MVVVVVGDVIVANKISVHFGSKLARAEKSFNLPDRIIAHQRSENKFNFSVLVLLLLLIRIFQFLSLLCLVEIYRGHKDKIFSTNNKHNNCHQYCHKQQLY